MILKFTAAGKFVMQIGGSGQGKGNTDKENVRQATDVFVDTSSKEVYVADGYGNKRVVVFDSETGKFKRMWGAFGNPPPETLAPNPATPQPQTTPDGPMEFGLPHAIKVSRDGVVYVADRINNRVQMFTTAKFLRQVRGQRRRNRRAGSAGFAFSPDRKQQFLYVVDSGLMRSSSSNVRRWRRSARSGCAAKAPASSTSSTTWRPTRRGISTAEIVNNRRAQKLVLVKK
jgi:DNA-binding beta-propeller fold protein YncE